MFILYMRGVLLNLIEVNYSKIKEINRKKIIKLLLERIEIIKLDIFRILGISIIIVFINIIEFKNEGIVEDVRLLEFIGGRKVIVIRLKEDCKFLIGVVLILNYIKIVLVNIKKEIIENIWISYNNDGIENLIKIINEKIDFIMKKYNLDFEKLLGIGLLLFGIVDFKEGIIKYLYLFGVKEFNLKEKF